ncbi:MAG: transglutaminase-like cysteine peptidase [Hyphomicrobiales bacterium]
MNLTGKTRPPIGHVQFCNSNPEHCKRVAGQDRSMELTAERWDELIRINHLVNQSVIPVSDLDLYARPEVWTFPGRYGDCEDYVLLKRHYLLEKGWPAGSLLITVVRRPDGEGHAVLTVRTDRGDFILDNLQPLIHHWTETPYAYVKRQSSKNPERWEGIADARGRVGPVASTN